MKKLLKPLLAASLLLLAVLCLSSCAEETPYASLDDQGYTVSVKYDPNGGVFQGTNNVTVVDVFNPDNAPTNANGEKEITLLSPDDSRRGDKDRAFSITRVGYTFAGWYTERALRTDENGNPLDEYGIPTSESGRTQGYVYANKWDFASDVLKIAPDAETSASTPYMTLYAAWIPEYIYEFYALNEETGTFEKYGESTESKLDVPAWDVKTGKMNMGDFLARDGMTLDGAFLDEAMQTPMSEPLVGTVDYEKGVVVNGIFKVYTTWLDGNWYQIHTAEQFKNNSRIDGNYVICADLDFSGIVWNTGLTVGQFSGTILGNGHKFSNITVTQPNNKAPYNGLFGAITESATIKDVSFENVTYKLTSGSLSNGPVFGLLAGSIADNATIESVTVTGTLRISDACFFQHPGYEIGLLCGSGSTHGIDVSGITCEVDAADPTAPKLSVAVDTDGTVTLTFVTNETVSDAS